MAEPKPVTAPALSCCRQQDKAPPPHLCAIPGCGVEIRRGLLMCLEHWRAVPKAKQMAVNRSWRVYRATGGAVRIEALAAYRRAVAAAVAAVEASLP